MDEDNFDVEKSRLQIKKLKEKVKSLVSEVDLSREIRSEEFSKTFKFQHESNVNDNASDFELGDTDSDEFLDFNEATTDETTWLSDSNSNTGVESAKDTFKALYADAYDYQADIDELLVELQLLRNPSLTSVGLNKSDGRSLLIDSRTFTRPKKYLSRPPLTSIVSNSGDDGRPGKLQRRLTTTILPTPTIINKLEELSKVNNRSISGSHGDGNWEEGSEEGLADIENSSRKSNRRSLPSSIIDRLQELKRANNSCISSKQSDKSRQCNGNVEETEKVFEDAKRVKIAFDLYVKNNLPMSSPTPDLYKSISEDHESFFSLDEVSGFCDRLTLSTDPSTYSVIVKEMEQKDICFYPSSESLEDPANRRMTFGGIELPPRNDLKFLGANPPTDHLLDLDKDLNDTYELHQDSNLKVNTTFEIIKRDTQPRLNTTYDAERRDGQTRLNDTYDAEKKDKQHRLNATYDAEKKQSLVDAILKSDIIKNLSPVYNNCDNKNVGERYLNNANDQLNEMHHQNALNKAHSEKYTTKIFDANFKKTSPPDRPNGKKDSDHSEDDCMSTTSDNSYRSVDSNSELKNIEELKSIAMQQNKRLSEVKFSTPRIGNTNSRHSDGWRNLSPIRRDVADVESQGSSNASSRGPSPRRSRFSDGSPAPRPSMVKQPSKVPQRELKLKPALILPTQKMKRVVSNGKSSAETVPSQKTDFKTVEPVGMSVTRPIAGPVSAPTSAASTRSMGRASGIPRPSSRLKQPQIGVSQLYRK